MWSKSLLSLLTFFVVRSGPFALIWLSIFPVLALAAPAVEFSRVRTVLARCTGCHGSSQQMRGLRLDTRTAAFDARKLLERVSSSKDGFRMPPSGPSLNSGEIGLLSAASRVVEGDAHDRALSFLDLFAAHVAYQDRFACHDFPPGLRSPLESED